MSNVKYKKNFNKSSINSTSTNGFLDEFKKKYTLKDIQEYIEKISDLKILVIGEAIIDEYAFGTSLGKAGKEPIIAFNVKYTEKYLGGSLAVANHLSNFCKNVDLISMLGDTKKQRSFIRNNLNNNIDPMFIYKKDSPTIVKRRYIDIESGEKIFEIYDFKDTELSPNQSQNLSNILRDIISKYDLIIISDFGHGFITSNIRETLYRGDYLAVNTQNNAGNQGMNSIIKYIYPNYICIDEKELRIACSDRYSDIEDLIYNGFYFQHMGTINITRGEYGSVIYDSTTGEFVKTPAFADKIVDKIGAGDAVLSITSPLASMEVNPEIIGFVGNSVGALAVAYSGNKESVNKEELYKFMEMMLK